MLRIRTAAILLILALLGATALRADDKSEAKADGKKVDTRAEQILRGAADYLQGLKSASTQIKSTLQITAPMGKQEMASVYKLAFEKPNRFALVLAQGDMGATMVSDGKKLTTYVPRAERYTVEDSPATLAEITGSDTIKAHQAHSLAFLGLFMVFRAPADLLKNVDVVSYVGEEQLDGRTVHHIEIETAQCDWEFWIEKGEKPWIWKVMPDIVKAMEKTGQQLPEGLKISTVATLTDWKADPELASEVFEFKAPESAKKVKSLFGPQPHHHHAPHALVGKKAPDFALETLGGKAVKLADHIEQKQVIILDFWATWCGPCVKALPTIAEVASKYKSKGVTFYAVNLAEDAPTVADFLKEQKLEVPVLMDKESKAAGLYEASAIPQTVLIGKDGVVQVVHVGLSEDLRERLTKELDDLLAGKELAKETLAKAQAEDEREEKADKEKSDDK